MNKVDGFLNKTPPKPIMTAFFFKKINKCFHIPLLAGLILLIYGQTLFFGFNLDDFLVLENTNGKVHNLADLAHLLSLPFNQADYRPVSMLSFGLENLLFGQIYPSVSHAINLLLFIGCAAAGYSMLLKLLHRKDPETVFISVLLFVSCTVNTEAVASIKSRDGLFSLLFTFLSIRLFYSERTGKTKLIFTAAAIICFFLAMLSKLDSIGILLFIPAVKFFMENRRGLMRLKTFGLLFSVLLLITLLRETIYTHYIKIPGESAKTIGQSTFTENPLSTRYTLPNRIAAGFKSSLIYSSKLIFPNDLRFYYGFNHYTLPGLSDLLVLFSILAHLVLFFLVWKARKENPDLWLALLGYFSFILFALNVITPVAGIVADRLVLQAGIWFWLFIVLGCQLLLGKIKREMYWPVIPALLAPVFIGTSAYRVSAWKEPVTLMDRDVPHLQDSYEGLRIAANLYKQTYDSNTTQLDRDNDLQKSIDCARQANVVFPNNVLMHRFLGGLLFTTGDTAGALHEMETALQYKADDVLSLIYLGDIYYSVKNYHQSLQRYTEALRFQPRNPQLINNISTVYFESGQKVACLQFNRDLLQTDSTLYPAWENLGYYYLDDGDTIQATGYFKKAVTLGLDAKSVPIALH